ncbi:MAG: hypothetical protein M3Y65_06820 [Pseudomonadota bacterium]|nr:hypothetical protein [Pseudomonadota bacterium]
MKAIFPALLLCLACAAAPAARASGDQGSSALSNASGLIAQGSATVVYGSLSAVAASGIVIVESVEVTGGASMVVLAGASNAASATLRLSGRAIEGASIVAGASVVVMAVSTGYVLVSAGQVLAFVPNELGKSLLHHSRVGA